MSEIRRQWASQGVQAPSAATRLVDPRLVLAQGLAAALLYDHGSAVWLTSDELGLAAPALLGLGAWSELRSPALIIERAGGAAPPGCHRGLYATEARLPVLEAATSSEARFLAVIGALVSERLGTPVVLRDYSVGEWELAPNGTANAAWSRLSSPQALVAETVGFHHQKRERRLRAIEPVAETLVVEAPGEGDGGVIFAGHLGAAAQARASARNVASLRFGMASPLPIDRLRRFLAARKDVLVLEEGEPFLLTALQALAQREGLRCRLRGLGASQPFRLTGEVLEEVLTKFAGPVRAEAEVPERDEQSRQAITGAARGIDADEREPWSLFFARIRGSLPTLPIGDPRLALFRALRDIGRPTLVVADEGTVSQQALRHQLIDVRAPIGLAAAVASALADVSYVVEEEGQPLVVALVTDGGALAGELASIVTNVAQRRDLLHVVLVARGKDAHDDRAELQLRAAGLQVSATALDEGTPNAAVSYAASRGGPRALVCYYDPSGSA